MDILPRAASPGVYCITNLLNGKLYIGSTRNIPTRWKEHRRALVSGLHHSVKLQHAFNKYGASAFVYAVIEYCDNSQKEMREQYWMDRTECYNPDKGYNVRVFAFTPISYVHNPEQRAKNRVALQNRKAKRLFNQVSDAYVILESMRVLGIPIPIRTFTEFVDDLMKPEPIEELICVRRFLKDGEEWQECAGPNDKRIMVRVPANVPVEHLTEGGN